MKAPSEYLIFMNTDFIIGTLLGTLISSIGYFYRRRFERKKVINQSLFSLLEIWSKLNKILKLNPDEYVNRLREYMIKKYPNYNLGANNHEAYNLIIKALQNSMIKNGLFNDNKSLLILFDQTVKDISTYLPVLAFELYKDHSIKNILSEIDDFTNSIFSNIELRPAENTVEAKQFVTDFLQDKIIKKSLELLESDLKIIARRSGIINRFKVKKLLKEKKNFEFDDNFFDSYIPGIINDMN